MAGPWEKYRSTRGVPIGLQDPAMDLKRPQVEVGIQAQQSNMQNDAVNRAHTRQVMDQEAAIFAERQRAAQAEAALKEMQAKAAQTEAASKSPLNAQQIQSAETDAMSKLRTIDRINRNAEDGWFPVGFGSEFMANLGGTAAANIGADVDSLKAGGALSEILKMTQATGKNPFTPMSNSDVETIARNIGNLSQKQSPDNFRANLDNYKNAYKNAYAGAVGLRTLNQEIERLLPTIPPAKREKFKADALRRYNQNMAAPRRPAPSAPRKQSNVIDFNDWKD